MATYYVGCVDSEGSNYGIWFPDFLGCVSAGGSFEEVMAQGEEALNFHVEGMREDGETIPPPRSAEAILADARFKDWIETARLVLVPLHEPMAVAAE